MSEETPNPGASSYTGLAVLLAAAVVLPIVLGLIISGKIGGNPLPIIAGLVVGIVLGGIIVTIKIREFM